MNRLIVIQDETGQERKLFYLQKAQRSSRWFSQLEIDYAQKLVNLFEAATDDKKREIGNALILLDAYCKSLICSTLKPLNQLGVFTSDTTRKVMQNERDKVDRDVFTAAPISYLGYETEPYSPKAEYEIAERPALPVRVYSAEEKAAFAQNYVCPKKRAAK